MYISSTIDVHSQQATLCYYDVKDALNLDPNHIEAQQMMSAVIQRGSSNKLQAMQLNIAGKHREALQKISTAIETNPSVADFHVLRYLTLSYIVYTYICWIFTNINHPVFSMES